MNHYLKRRISYFLKARHSKGHGIHSPFLFRLITQVIENKGHFSAYPLLNSAGENMQNMLDILDFESFRQLKCSEHDLRNLHRLSPKYDRLLFRLVNDFAPASIAFYGSTFGVTLLALAMADRRKSVVAQLNNDHFRSFCRRLADVYEVGNIEITETGIVAAADFVVIQNPLDPENCSQILSAVLGRKDFQGTVVVCGIHYSSEMEAVWASHKSKSAVRVTLDLLEIGIFICREGLQKEEFMLRFC